MYWRLEVCARSGFSLNLPSKIVLPNSNRRVGRSLVARTTWNVANRSRVKRGLPRRATRRRSRVRRTFYQLALLLDFYRTPCAPLQLYAVSPTMPERKTRGAFIVVEGLDRSGKSTQVSLLEERLKATGVSVRLVKFPGK